jgi:hypothetical protein
MRHKKAYVLYANESYFEIVSACADSIRAFSDLPIYVYLLNCDLVVPNTTTIKWVCDIDADEDEQMYNVGKDANFYVNRNSKRIFRLIKERPKIIKDAILKYADNVAYIDCDSVATKHIDSIFSMFPPFSPHPYFTDGIYEYLLYEGRGGAESRRDLSTTLEQPACALFGINQYARKTYRTSNIFVAGKNCIDFLDEWYWMCVHPKVLENPNHYAPFQEETIANVLLWKYNYQDGLPYVYTNASLDKIDEIYNEIGFTGETQYFGNWFKLPAKEEHLIAFHGEKRVNIMKQMIEKLKTI